MWRPFCLGALPSRVLLTGRHISVVATLYPKSGPRIRCAKKNDIPDDVVFRTKPQIGLGMIDRALAHEVRVGAWTFDEGYGRDTAFLDGLEQRRQVFVGEVPANFHGWVIKPRVLKKGPSRRARPQEHEKVSTFGAWPARRAKCKTWCVIRQPSASGHGSVTASRIPSRGPRFGK